MDESEASVSKTEPEIKPGDDGVVKEKAAEPEPEPEACSEPGGDKEKSVPEDGSGLYSFVKPLVEELGQEAKALVENVLPPSSDVSEVEKEVEKMVLASDPLAGLKNLDHDQTPDSSEPLPTSDKNVCESSEDANKKSSNEQENLDRSMKTQPFAAVSAGSRDSWTNCCGLLDIFSRADQ